MEEKIVREEIIPVKGTTKLTVGDPFYFENISTLSPKRVKELTFDGNISAAPLGMLVVRQIEYTEESIYSEKKIQFTSINVHILQADTTKKLQVYLNNRHFPEKIKNEVELGCDTASFMIKTKFGSDYFSTGADGYYGSMIQYKQYFGMRLELDFDTSLFSFDEIRERILTLFPKRERLPLMPA